MSTRAKNYLMMAISTRVTEILFRFPYLAVMNPTLMLTFNGHKRREQFAHQGRAHMEF